MEISSVFIDYVTIRQDYFGGGLPVLNDGRVLKVDSDGEIEYSTDVRCIIEGSYDSRVQVRCDGNTVEFTGNISRYGRRDNLFGYDWQTTIARINDLLLLLGLPPFTSGKLYKFADTGWSWSGARVSRIDLTANYSTGSKDAMHVVLCHMASHHVGRQKGSLSPDSGTVEYGRGSKYVYGKLYAKYQELEKHRFKKSGSHVSDDVIDYCKTEGILREEFTLKSRFLLQNNLAYLGAITQDNLNQIYADRTQLQRLEQVKYDDFKDLPRGLKSTYASWKLGLPLDIKRSAFYKHRKALLAYGIDISIPNNVHHLPSRVRVVELKALTAPDWYIQNYG